ncbi:MAG: hypothetical protein RLZ33_2196 [Bacteroidota bacterium]|jgi:gamma-glutamylcyclotransferase (GGCT)/AIG2-like uncharacterized protein YtfP
MKLVDYEHQSENLSSMDDVKIYSYMQIYASGKVIEINEAGVATVFTIDSSLVAVLDALTSKGLEYLRNKEKPQANHFHSGTYYYLEKNNATVCFDPYAPNEQTNKAIKNIRSALKAAVKSNETSTTKIDTELIESIKSAHAISNLNVISNPPPDPGR